MQSQSEVPEFPRLRPYSRQLLQTFTLHARQNAPRFMIRPNSDRHRPQLRFGSEAHKLLRPLAKLMLLVKFEFDVGWATGAQWCVLMRFFPVKKSKRFKRALVEVLLRSGKCCQHLNFNLNWTQGLKVKHCRALSTNFFYKIVCLYTSSQLSHP